MKITKQNKNFIHYLSDIRLLIGFFYKISPVNRHGHHLSIPIIIHLVIIAYSIHIFIL